jgi:hypothetical protein
VKAVTAWLKTAGFGEGPLFRPVAKADFPNYAENAPFSEPLASSWPKEDKPFGLSPLPAIDAPIIYLLAISSAFFKLSALFSSPRRSSAERSG